MNFVKHFPKARSTTHCDWCGRNYRWTQWGINTLLALSPISVSKTSRKEKTPGENNEVHVRRNLLKKSESLLEKVLKIGNNSNVPEFPKFWSLKKIWRVRYFKENNITSEDDFIIHIFQLCKNYLDTIIMQYRNGNNDNYDNIIYALDSLDNYKTYLKLDENNKTYQRYIYVYNLLNNLQKLENLRLEL